MARGLAPASRMKPGSGGGVVKNANANTKQRTNYAKSPAKRPGVSGDNPKKAKKSPFGR